MNDKYDFASLADVIKAIDALPDSDKKDYNAKMDQIEPAAKAFLRTRTNCELLDMADEQWPSGGHQMSLWDYIGTFCDWYQEETDRRNWPVETDLYKLLQEWGENWAQDEDSIRQRFFALEKQVKGIQKKVDRLLILLKDREFKVDAKSFVEMR